MTNLLITLNYILSDNLDDTCIFIAIMLLLIIITTCVCWIIESIYIKIKSYRLKKKEKLYNHLIESNLVSKTNWIYVDIVSFNQEKGLEFSDSVPCHSYKEIIKYIRCWKDGHSKSIIQKIILTPEYYTND